MSLKNYDNKVYKILQNEINRQKYNINLTASDNFASNSILEALGSPMQNKYSEGYVGSRYYGGTKYIDEMESLCIERALKAFNISKDNWGVNVQSLSGSPANIYSFGSVCEVGDTILALETKYGGHYSHGLNYDQMVSFSSKYYNFVHYKSKNFNEIDFEEINKLTKKHKPKILLAGYSVFTKFLNYEIFKKIAHDNGCLLMADISHISGMVSSQLVKYNPFDYCDIITTTTHKCLRGPRGSLIFFNKNNPFYTDLEKRVNNSVFPGHQGGPHNHTISALCVALKHCNSEEFINYQKNILKNAFVMSKYLKELGIELLGGGTDNHMIMINLKNLELDANKLNFLADKLNISFNVIPIPDQDIANNPYGIRIGTPAMTTRGCNEDDFKIIAEIFYKMVQISNKYNKSNQSLDDYKILITESIEDNKEYREIQTQILNFLDKFPLHYNIN